MDSVTVTERPYQRTASVAKSTIDAATLEQIQPLQITEAIRAVPGLFVQDYGGIGGLKTVSIRGGSSAQSLTLLNGVRFNSAQNGQMDLSVIPASFLSSINVSKGALSALYGANALTGAVDLQMELPTENRVRAFAEGGSFNTWRLAANGVSSIGDVRIGASS